MSGVGHRGAGRINIKTPHICTAVCGRHEGWIKKYTNPSHLCSNGRMTRYERGRINIKTPHICTARGKSAVVSSEALRWL